MRLQNGSPAIDAGDHSAVPVGVITDLAGQARFVDHSQADTGSGSPPIVNMGAFEATGIMVVLSEKVYLSLLLK